MATLLRSLKFVRKLNVGSGRRLGCPIRNLDTGNSTYARTRCLAVVSSDRNYVTRAAFERSNVNGQDKVDLMLNEIDRKIKIHVNVYKTDIEAILEAATKRGSLTSTQALLLIRCCGEFLFTESFKTRKSLVNEIWELIKSQEVPIDVSHYNALLLVHLENETDFSPSEILLDMKNKNIKPNRVTFQRLIEQYCNKGDINGATKILEHMSDEGLPVNENIFNSLIKGHSEAGDMPNALKVLDIMKKAGIVPSSRTYTALICAHSKVGDLDSIRSRLNDCREKDIQLSDKEVLQIIYTMAISNNGSHHNLIEEMIPCLVKGVMYNREALLVIYRLVEKGQEKVAYKILKTMVKSSKMSTEKSNSGSFFIKKMVTSNSSPETIIKYCKLMIEEDVNDNPFEVAVHCAFFNNMQHLALPLIEAWKATGGEIREHYFYPIFVWYSKLNNLQGIINTMKSMIFEFNITPSIMTVKEYIVPYLVEDPLSNATNLANNNLPFSIAANAILFDLLMNNKTHQANQFMLQTTMAYRSGLLKRPLILSLMRTNDIKSFINIIHVQYSRLLTEESDKNYADGSDEAGNRIQFVNDTILKAVTEIPSYNPDMIVSILENLLEKGISLEVETVEKIKNHLDKHLTPEIEQILSKLTEDLEIVPIKKDQWVSKDKVQVPNSAYFEKKIKRDIQNLEEKATEVPEFKMLLAQHYIKLKDNESVLKLVKELEDSGVEYTVGFCATMIDYFSKLDKFEEATKWFKRMKEINPDSAIDKAKILNYASTLVRNKLPEEALKVLDTPVHDANSDKSILCERLFFALSQHCPDHLESFFIKLKEKGLLENITANHLGPLIKKYIEAEDYEKAIEKFQWACETFKLTPQKNVLMMRLIEKEDAKSLQRVTDLCTQVYGEVSALFDLAVSFFECNRVRQARKILETPGLLLVKSRIMYTVDRLSNQYEPEKLEKFIQLLSGLYMNMDPLYVALIKEYEKTGAWDKCLALWTQMQEDNVQPSITFMQHLEKILRDHNQTVPFAKSLDIEETEYEKNVKEFHKYIVNNEFEKAEKCLEKLPEEEIFRHEIKLAEAYISQDNLPKALKYMQDFLQKKNMTFENTEFVIQKILENIIQKGDFNLMVTTVKTIENYIRKNNNIKFAPYISIMNTKVLESGKFGDYVEYLDKLLNESNTEIVNKLFHTTISAQALAQHPEILEQFEKFAYKALEKNIYGPINTLWGHYFLENNPEADKIWNNHLKNSPAIHVISMSYMIKDRQVWNRLPELAELVVDAPNIHSLNKKRNYHAILRNILSSDVSNKYEIAYECLRHTLKAVPIRHMDSNIIAKIESNLPEGCSIESLKTDERTKEEIADTTMAVKT